MDDLQDGRDDLERLVFDGADAGAAMSAFGDTAPAFTLAFLRTCPDCVELINAAGRLTFMNENGRRAMEIEGFDRLRGTAWLDLWPAESRPLAENAMERALAGEAVRLTAARPTVRGAHKVWEITVSPVTNRDGVVESIFSVARETR